MSDLTRRHEQISDLIFAAANECDYNDHANTQYRIIKTYKGETK